MPKDKKPIPSSVSTGGGGTNYENEVQAKFLVQSAFLSLGLSRAFFPYLADSEFVSLLLQGRREEYATDDMILTVKDSSGQERKLLASVKLKVPITEKDETFQDVIEEFWEDFNNEEKFDPEVDVLVLIASSFAQSVEKYVIPFLQDAVSSPTWEDFQNKLQSNVKKKHYFEIFHNKVRKIDEDVSEKRIWGFLQVVKILEYDLSLNESKERDKILSILKVVFRENEEISSPKSLWDKIINFVKESNEGGVLITPENVPDEIKSCFSYDLSKSISKLLHHSETLLGNISDKIAGEAHISRPRAVQDIELIIKNNDIILLSGKAGFGKSALAKNIIKKLQKDTPVFAFNTREFSYPHIDNVLANINISVSFEELTKSFQFLPEKIFYLDSFEKILETDEEAAFRQVLERIASRPDWKIIATCRSHFVNQISNYLPSSEAKSDICLVKVEPFQRKDLEEIKVKFPHINHLLSNPKLEKILLNPFYLDLVCKASWDISDEEVDDFTEEDLQNVIWNKVIRKDSTTARGLPEKRERCFQEVARTRAEKMQFFVKYEGEYIEAYQGLIEDHLLVTNNDNQVAPAHDIFEDWALYRHLNVLFESNSTNPEGFFSTLSTQPTLRKAFRFWLIDRLEVPSITLESFVKKTICGKEIDIYWRDEAILAYLNAKNGEQFFEEFEEELLSGNQELLRKVLNLMRSACHEPHSKMIDSFSEKDLSENYRGFQFRRPIFPMWKKAFEFIHSNLRRISSSFTGLYVDLIREWCDGSHVEEELPEGSQTVAFLALSILKALEEIKAQTGSSYEIEKELCRFVLKLSGSIPSKIKQMFETIQRADTFRGSYLEHIRDFVLKPNICPEICKYFPDNVIDLARRALIAPKEERRSYYLSNQRIEEAFGVRRDYDFNPSSALQGPFYCLLKFHPEKGIGFILEFVNQATKRYTESEYVARIEPDKPIQIEVELESEKTLEVWCNERLWLMYRATSVGPHLFQSALMALEKWLYENFDKGQRIDLHIKEIIEKLESASIVSVLISIATAFPSEMAGFVAPFLRIRDFYKWDQTRSLKERDSHGINRMNLAYQNHKQELLNLERRYSNNLKHRNHNMFYLLAFLQTRDSSKEIAFKALDKLYRNLPEKDSQQEQDILFENQLSKVDVRNFRKTTIEENGEAIEVFVSPESSQEAEEIAKRYGKDAENVLNAIKLDLWARSIISEDEEEDTSFSWNEVYEKASGLEARLKDLEENNRLFVIPMLSKVASALLKNYVEELKDEQKRWCYQVLKRSLDIYVEKLLENPLSESLDFIRQQHKTDTSIRFLPLFSRLFDEGIFQQVTHQTDLAILLLFILQPNPQIRLNAVEACREYVWDSNSDFVERCICGLIEFASTKIYQQYGEKIHQLGGKEEYKKELRKTWNSLIERIVEEENIVKYELESLSFESHAPDELHLALALIPFNSNREEHSQLYQALLIEWLNLSEQENERQDLRGVPINEFKFRFFKLFSRFLLSQPVEKINVLLKPILENVKEGNKLDFISSIVGHLIICELEMRTGEKFWSIWEKVVEAILSEGCYYQKQGYGNLLNAIFWLINDLEEDKSRLESRKSLICKVTREVGKSDHFSLYYLLRHFNSIGGIFLPEGLLWIQRAILENEDEHLLERSWTKHYLEKLLSKAIYEHKKEIKQEKVLREAMVQLLDSMVEMGSPLAYSLREKVIAPIGG